MGPGSQSTPRQRLFIALLSVLILAVSVLYIGRGSDYWEINTDSALYVGTARSIAAGEGISFDGEPMVKAPPGLPLLLAAQIMVFGESYRILASISALTVLGYLVCCFVLIRREDGVRPAALVVALMTCSLTLFEHVNLVNAEIPYALFSVLALLSVTRLAVEERRVLTWSILCAGLFLSCYFVRTVGISLLGAALVTLLGPRPQTGPVPYRWRKLVAVAVLCLVPMGLWSWRNRALAGGEGGSYLQDLVTGSNSTIVHNVDPIVATPGMVVAQLSTNFTNHPEIFGQVLFNRSAREGWTAVAWLAFVCVLAGLALSLRRRRSALEWYLLFYLAIHFLWPFDLGNSYLMPVLFLFFLYPLRLYKAMRTRTGTGGRRTLRAAAAMVLVGFFAHGSYSITQKAVRDGDPPWRAPPRERSFRKPGRRRCLSPHRRARRGRGRDHVRLPPHAPRPHRQAHDALHGFAQGA